MSEKFERKYKALLDNRQGLLEKQRAVIAIATPLMGSVVQANYGEVESWMATLQDLQFIEASIEKHSIVELSLARDLLKQCGPVVNELLGDGEEFADVNAFVKRIGELTTEYITKLTPIVSNKRIMDLIAEANWLGVRQTMCKIHANSLSGKDMQQPIDHFKSNWFMGGGKKKNE